jgi:putative ABC transport system permease protein
MLRNPRRTGFSLLSIALATAAILVFESFKQSLIKATRHNIITAHYGHFEITKNGYKEGKDENPYGFQIEDTEQLRSQINEKVGNLRFMSRRQEFFGLLNYNDRSFGAVGLGIDAKEEIKFMTLAQVNEGVHLADSHPQSIFLGYGVAKTLRLKVGDVVTVLVTTAQGSMNALDLTVVGTFKTGVNDLDDRAFYVHQETAQELLKVQGAPRILIGFAQDDELPLQMPLNQLLSQSFPDLKASHWMERATFYDNLLGWMKQQIFVFYVIVMVISTLSIANVFTMGLLERIGEFGTLRAIGTYASEVRSLIFVESILQSLLGSLLGVAIGLFIIQVPLHNGILMPPPPMMSTAFLVHFEQPWNQVIPTILICTFVSAISGILPAVKIGRMGIVEALGRNV